MKRILVDNCAQCPYVHVRMMGRSIKCFHPKFYTSATNCVRPYCTPLKPQGEYIPIIANIKVMVPVWCPLEDQV